MLRSSKIGRRGGVAGLGAILALSQDHMKAAHSGPFENIESAHEYVGLLLEALTEATTTIGQEIETPSEMARDRHLDALRLIDYKLKTLERHLTLSRRLLTDLRSLRRYLFDERTLEANYTAVAKRRES